jgi:heat shock protein HslJ
MMKTISAVCLLFLLACQNPAGGSSKAVADTPAAVPAPPPSAAEGLPQATRVPDTTSLAGTWYLQPVLDSDTTTGTGKLPWIQFDLVKSRFIGNTGCNTMRGEFWFSKNDSSLSFNDKLATTRMVCPGYNEPAFLKSLRSAAHYRLRQGMLTLVGDDNLELSRWKRKG